MAVSVQSSGFELTDIVFLKNLRALTQVLPVARRTERNGFSRCLRWPSLDSADGHTVEQVVLLGALVWPRNQLSGS